MSDDEGAENAAMRVMFALTLAFVLVGLAYVVALGLLHR
jgi:hypothetical protein